MKKMISLALCFMLVMSMLCMTAFAAGSKTDAVEVDSDVEVTVEDTTVALLTEEIAAAVSGEDAKELKVLWQKDLHAETLPATITFNVDGTDGEDLLVFHYNGTEWELVGRGKGPAVTVTFTDLSPVGLVHKKATTPSGPISPATGLGAGIYVACAVLAAAGSAAALVAKKEN